MCGRYRPASDKQRISETFHVESGLEEIDLTGEAVATPGSFQPVIFSSREGETRIQRMFWGFELPDRLVFNARSDKLLTNSLWNSALESHRCIVPVDSILERQQLFKEARRNPKFEISVKGQRPFGVAALWRPWKNLKTGKTEPTVAIITTDPNERWLELHDRQTAILRQDEYQAWLLASERPPLHCLRVFPDEKMEFIPVCDEAEQLSLLG